MGNGFAPFEEMEPLQILFSKLRGSTPFLLDSNTKGIPENLEWFKRQAFSPALHDLTADCLNYSESSRYNNIKNIIIVLSKTNLNWIFRPTAEQLLQNPLLGKDAFKFEKLFTQAEVLKVNELES